MSFSDMSIINSYIACFKKNDIRTISPCLREQKMYILSINLSYMRPWTISSKESLKKTCILIQAPAHSETGKRTKILIIKIRTLRKQVAHIIITRFLTLLKMPRLENLPGNSLTHRRVFQGRLSLNTFNYSSACSTVPSHSSMLI